LTYVNAHFFRAIDCRRASDETDYGGEIKGAEHKDDCNRSSVIGPRKLCYVRIEDPSNLNAFNGESLMSYPAALNSILTRNHQHHNSTNQGIALRFVLLRKVNPITA